jgi:hypothetical protein
MKKLIVAGMLSVFALGAMATEPKSEHPDKYCVKMKDGQKKVMHNGIAITKEVTLDDGTKIKPDGTITKSDGTTTTLNEGQCMSKDGMVVDKKKDKKNRDDDNNNRDDNPNKDKNY